MIRLLIVDDEQLEIDAIRSAIDFAALGIDVVGEANNIRQAREFMIGQPVDILLCDIEMPRGSGIDLLKWVREYSPQTECIFLTCHAEFEYARQAIALGSLDYLLKPARDEDLFDVLRKAADKVRQTSEQLSDQQFSKLWLRHQPLVVEKFWLDIIQQKTRSDLDEIRKAAAAIDLPGLENMRVMPILISIKSWKEPLTARYEKLMEFALRNIGEELILKNPDEGIIFELQHNSLLALLYLDQDAELETDLLRQACEDVIAAAIKYLKCDLCCYLGSASYLNELENTVTVLGALDLDNISAFNRVFSPGERFGEQQDTMLPDINRWMTMLEDDSERLLAAIETYFAATFRESNLGAAFLYRFQQDFIQAVHAFLKQKGIQSHQLFGDSQSISLFNQATQSIEKMKLWTKTVVKKTACYLKDTAKSQTVVSKIKQYITENIDKDLSSDEIASQVFLNPIYLSRLLKKETGMAISEYLIHERLELACSLLENTGLPVSTIAVRVGYANFSYFSRLFRKNIGQTPLEYRKQINKDQ